MANMEYSEWGPLAALVGTWEGSQGLDVAPSDGRATEKNSFRERIVFEPLSRVDNHEQTLYGLRYRTTAWRLGEPDPFHEEVGYWLWDGKEKNVFRCFIVPRGVTVLAGGKCEPSAKDFSMAAKVGDKVFGICSNPFLDREFQTIEYRLSIKVLDDDTFFYEEDTVLKMPGKKDLFHHTDRNTLKRVTS